MYAFFCRNLKLAYIYEQSLYLISRDAEKGIFKATQQQQNRKAKQHNTTRPKPSFFKNKLATSHDNNTMASYCTSV